MIHSAKLISWILESVDANIGIPMHGFRTIAGIWYYLAKVYPQSNLARKFQIKHDIFFYSQGKRKIQEYYAGFIFFGMKMN